MKKLFRSALFAAALAAACAVQAVTLWSPNQGDLNFPGLTASAAGSTAPAAGSFSTLSASGAVSGAGFVNLMAAPGPIGSTTASTGSFTTLSATTINGNTITAGSSTFTGTAAQVYTFPTTTATLARTDAAQTFTGVQTFSNPPQIPAPVTAPCTAHAYTVAATDAYNITNDSATCTLTLPAAASFAGRRLVVKTTAAFTVVSASSNVVPQASATAGTAILAGTAGKYAELVSDGTNWVTFAAN